MVGSRVLLLPALLTFTQTCLSLQRANSHLPYQAFSKSVPLYRNLSTSRLQAMAEENQTKHVVVYVTVANKDEGKDLAKTIINAKLAACVNQVPGVESTYWWEGKVETDSEVLLIIKTRKSLLEDLIQHVIKNHKYEVPEVIALPIIGGNPAYLKWLDDSTKTPDEVPESS